MIKKKRRKISKKIWSIFVVILTIIYSIYESEIKETFGMPDSNPVFNEVESNLIVRFIDVGQADAILIQNQGKNMLIDAGNNEDGELLVKYFEQLGIKQFSYIIGTHPHEDHIGGLDDVINSFIVDKIYLPDAITTTATFMDVLDAIENHHLTYTVPKIGEVFHLGEATLLVIYTGTDTSDLNNTSIVLRLDFGENSFLFTGDATDKTEKKILNQNIEVDVLKVAHHGSNYSTTNEFLETVNPKYAIISVGKDNSYKHPHKEIIQKFKQFGTKIYRTDQLGTIMVHSNGSEFRITTEKTNTNGG